MRERQPTVSGPHCGRREKHENRGRDAQFHELDSMLTK
jgi:hypothetical protein